jgi:mannan endo-1,4-beta-mannosidase
MKRTLTVAAGGIAAVAALAALTAGGASALPRPAAAGGVVAHVASAPAHKATAPPSVLLPPPGEVYTGVSSGSTGEFAAEVGKHPAVYGEFVTWGQSIHFAFNDAAAAHTRLMLHISTSQGFGARQAITPGGIAAGDGDGYLLSLSQLIAAHGRPVYIRLFPEMNNANNAYSAYNMDGSSRGPLYSTTAFIAAWRRVVTVLRGGPVTLIDERLAALGQPRLHGIAAGGEVARSAVSFVWTPETAGTPAIAANDPINYYPGDAYVDWVGTDFYSKFPNFTGLDTFYKQFSSKPFAFGEWAIWGGDNPGFVNELFAWVNQHQRVKMLVYNQGILTNGPFRLNLDPASTAAIRAQLAPQRFLAYTSDS